ncbi:MAG: S8 family peptidase [Stackebrandtia sp.]
MSPIRRRLAAAVGVAATAAVAAAVLGASPAQAEGEILGQNDPNAVEGEYIVVMEDGVSASSAADVAGAFNGDVRETFEFMDGFSAEMSSSDAKALAGDPDVAYVAQNAEVGLAATQDNPPSWGLDRIDQTPTAGDDSYTYPDTAGEGVTAYILDTGIDADHPEFGGRATHGVDTTGEGAGDGHGHGTHVSGTVASESYGVAKAASLVEVKVLNSAGSGTYEGVIEGIEWVTANHSGPSVANMSLGGPASQPVEDAVTASVESGVVYALAAGNDSGQDACTRSPAGAEGALTVGSTNSGDNRSSFSNIGTCVNLFAPGEQITSTWKDGGTNTISGTSMATPHVAGAAALVLGENPDADPATVNAALEDNALEGVVGNPGTGSPNKLLNIEFLNGGDPGEPGQCSAENVDAVAIADKATVESSVSVECGESASAQAEVAVDVTHTYRGDLSIALVSPSGERYTLKRANVFDGADDVKETYVVDLSGHEADGEWTLVVRDHYRGDSGTLNSWTLEA